MADLPDSSSRITPCRCQDRFPGKIFLAPAFLANQYPDIFFAAGIGFVLLVMLLLSDPSILLNLLFFWLTFNLYIVGFPISDGADVVLFMLSFWSIPLVRSGYRQVVKATSVIQTALFNLAILFCQLQIVFIYAVSGSG